MTHLDPSRHEVTDYSRLDYSRPDTSRDGLGEARPLLQAIFLGILLAAALVAAAAFAGPAASERGRSILSLSSAQDTAPPATSRLPGQDRS